jgi:hypothetical protein
MLDWDAVGKKIFSDPRAGRKILMGVVLAYLPVIHFLVLGYGYQYLRQIRSSGRWQLPEWTDWARLFSDTLRALAVVAIYALLPLAVVSIIAALLVWLLPTAFGAVATVIFIPVMLALPLVVVQGWIYLQEKRRWEALRDYATLFRRSWQAGQSLSVVILVLAWWGLIFLGGVVFYGFTLFAGMIGFCALMSISTKVSRPGQF